MAFIPWLYDPTTGNEKVAKVDLTSMVTGLLPATNMNVDNTSLDGSGSTLSVKALGITAAKLSVGVGTDWQQLVYDASSSALAWRTNTAIVQPCRVVATTNITISGPGTTIDGITLNTNDRVLLTGQSTASQNGCYVFNGSAVAMTRTTDTNAGTRLASGTMVQVWAGTIGANTIWILSTDSAITVGTTPLTFTKLNASSSGTVTTVSVVTANGVSGSVSNPTTTPAITITLGAITPTSVTMGGSAQTVNSITAAAQSLGTTQNATSELFAQYSNDALGPNIQFLKSRGTSVGTKTVTQSGDLIGEFDFFGVNSTPAIAVAAKIKAATDGSPGSSFVPGRLEFWTGTNIAAPVLAGMFANGGQFVLGNNPFLAPLSFQSITPAFQVLGASQAAASMALQMYAANALAPIIGFSKSRATSIGATGVATSNSDVIGRLEYQGINSSTSTADMGYFQLVQDGSAGSSFNPARFEWALSTNAIGPNTIATMNTTGLNIGGTPSTIFGVSSNHPIIDIADTAGSGNRWQIRNGVGATGGFEIYDFTNSKTRIMVQDDGNVNIGAASNPANNSRVYIFGGANGANVDVRGDATTSDQSTIELEGSDYDTNTQSIRMQYYGATNAFGTTLGYANTDLGVLAWQGVNPQKAIIATFNNSDIHFGTNATEWMMLSKLGDLGIHTTSPSANFQVNQATYGPGTVSNSASSGAITGVGTQFTNTFKIGDSITIGSETKTISAIASDTSLTTAAFTSAHSNVTYSLTGGTRFQVFGNGNTVASGTFSASNFSGSSSGTNTGDQTISLTGDVTGSGTSSFAATIAAGAVSLSKMANLAANSIIGNNTGSPATPIALSVSQVQSLLGLSSTYVPYTGASSNVNLGTHTLSSGQLTCSNAGGTDSASLGSELTTNGTFSGSATGWALGTDWAYNTNKVTLTLASSGMGYLTQNISVVNGTSYLISWTQQHSSANNGRIQVSLGVISSGGIIFNDTISFSSSVVIPATTTGSVTLAFIPTYESSGTINISNVSVKAITPATSSLTLEDSSGSISATFYGKNDNTSLGFNTLLNNTSGLQNTAFGYQSLSSNTSGQGNTAVGYLALIQNSVGIANTAVGYYSLSNNIIGNENCAFGDSSLVNNISGLANCGFGNGSLGNNLSGSYNIGVGSNSLTSNTFGTNNVGVGANSLGSNLIGNYNSALGDSSLTNATGSYNSALGSSALGNITSGSYNVGIGYNVQCPSNTSDGQLSIQNIIYGFGNTGTGSTTSTGRIFIGTQTDDGVSKLGVAGAVTANTYGTTTVSNGTVTTALTVNWQNGSLQTCTLTAANTCVLTFTAPVTPGSYLTLEVTQSSTPTGKFTLPASVVVTPGQIKQAPANGSWVTVLQMYWDGTSYFLTNSFYKNGPMNYDYFYVPNIIDVGGSDIGKAGNGSYIGWNYTGGSAEMDFINQSSGAVGGWNWFKSDGTTITDVMQLTAGGALTFPNGGNISTSGSNSGLQFLDRTTSRAWQWYGSSDVAKLSNGTSDILQITSTGGIIVPNPGYIDFQATTRQMINLWGGGANAQYGIGVQSATQYYRTSATTGAFAWFSGGTHSNTQFDPGAGGVVLAELLATGTFLATAYAKTTKAIGTVTSTASLNFQAGASNTLTLTSATACTISVGTAPSLSNTELTLAITQPASGTIPIVTFPSSFVFKGKIPVQPVPVLGSTTLYQIMYDGTNYYVQDVSSSTGIPAFSYPVYNTVAITTSNTYVSNPFFIPANSLQVGMSGRFKMWVTKASGAGALTVQLSFGTAGTTADTNINGSAAGGAGTAAGSASIEILWIVRAIGSSGTIDVFTHADGVAPIASIATQNTATVNTTVNNYMGVRMSAGANSINTLNALIPELLA